MYIFYNANAEKSDFDPARLKKMNPNKMYLQHLDNMLVLKFIEQKSENRIEKIQAANEMVICERKLDFWKRRIDNHDYVNNETLKRKNQWKDSKLPV